MTEQIAPAGKLTDLEKAALVYIVESKQPDWDTEFLQQLDVGGVEKEDVWKALGHLGDLGAITSSKDKVVVLTNKGVAYLIVECGMTLHQLIPLVPDKFAEAQKEYEAVKAHIKTENNLDVFYYHTFKLYLEWDLFDPNTNDFKQLSMREAQKVQLEIAGRLIDDKRIPVEYILSVIGVPQGMIKQMRLDASAAKAIISQMRGFF